MQGTAGCGAVMLMELCLWYCTLVPSHMHMYKYCDDPTIVESELLLRCRGCKLNLAEERWPEPGGATASGGHRHAPRACTMPGGLRYRTLMVMRCGMPGMCLLRAGDTSDIHIIMSFLGR